jgi:hypothetical protein
MKWTGIGQHWQDKEWANWSVVVEELRLAALGGNNGGVVGPSGRRGELIRKMRNASVEREIKQYQTDRQRYWELIGF